MLRNFALILAGVLGLGGTAFAGGISINDARAEMMEGKTDRGDIFMKITNSGASVDRLYAVRTNIAKKAILETETEENVMAGKSATATALVVRPGETVALTEEGAHVELFGLSKPFKEGETFTATLYFERAGRVKVKVNVKAGIDEAHVQQSQKK